MRYILALMLIPLLGACSGFNAKIDMSPQLEKKQTHRYHQGKDQIISRKKHKVYLSYDLPKVRAGRTINMSVELYNAGNKALKFSTESITINTSFDKEVEVVPGQVLVNEIEREAASKVKGMTYAQQRALDNLEDKKQREIEQLRSNLGIDQEAPEDAGLLTKTLYNSMVMQPRMIEYHSRLPAIEEKYLAEEERIIARYAKLVGEEEKKQAKLSAEQKRKVLIKQMVPPKKTAGGLIRFKAPILPKKVNNATLTLSVKAGREQHDFRFRYDREVR